MFSSLYLETDRSKKDLYWLNNVVSEIRLTGYKELVTHREAANNRSIINGNINMDNIKKMFKNYDKLETEGGFQIISLFVMEKIKNLLTAEKQRIELKSYVDSQDPTLVHYKKRDKNLLKNKERIDNTTNNLRKKLGLPPIYINNDDFSGNYDDFEAMGFNTSEPMDVEAFFDYFYLLDIESIFQKTINHTFEINSVSELTTEFVEDIMATKTVVFQQFVNKITGQITFRRIIPEHTFAIRSGKGKTERQDVAVGYYERVTVNEFIKRAGNNFNWKENYIQLLAGVNYINSSQYTAIQIAEGQYFGNQNGNITTISSLLTYEVEICYMEFKSIDIDKFREYENPLGNFKLWPLRDKDKEITNKNPYTEKHDIKERTYYAWFLNTSPTNQIIYDGGLLYHQETEGQYDEISAYSLKYMQYKGKTIAEIAKPWIETANEAFTKFRFLLRKAKRDGTSYNLQSLIEVTKSFYNNDASAPNLTAMINKMEDSANDIWSFPMDSTGQYSPVQGGVNRPKVDNFDSKFKSFKDIIEWCYNMIKLDIGINDLREGATPSTNDVFKLEQKSLEQSSNATFYIDDIMNYIYISSGRSTLAYLMDIIRYKSTLPYEYIKSVFGEQACKSLQQLPKISPHRMDIYVSSFANAADRKRVFQESQMALQGKQIDYKDYIIINGINDHRKAQKFLVISMERQKKELEKLAQQQHERSIELDNIMTENKMKLEQMKGNIEIKKAQIMTDGYVRSAMINKDAKIQTKQTEELGEFDKENLKYQQEQREAIGMS
jgi:hypothetical protein